jgi:RimJ/RimL family protein N-acetyltransferase
MAPSLVTTRLTLGPWRDDDVDPYFAMVYERDERAASAPRNDRPTRDDLVDEIPVRLRELDETGIALLAMRLDGTFIGYAGLTTGKASLDEPEIAYELLREFHGFGYATEAALAVVTAAETTGRTRLWASVRTWNEASFRVLEKVGFVGTERVTRDEFGETVWWTRSLRP